MKCYTILWAQLGGAAVGVLVGFILREAFHVQREIAGCVAVLVGAAAVIGIEKSRQRFSGRRANREKS
jgi:hypothetical protein